MAVLSGFISPTLGPAYLPKSDNVDVSIGHHLSNLAGASSPCLYSSEFSDNTPVELVSRQIDGFIGDSQSTYWFNRVHVMPIAIDLGNVVDGQTAQFYVWNAYFTSQLLGAISTSGDEGLSLIEHESAPTSFYALEQRTYTLVASMDGPSVIDADYVFSFPQDIVTLHVTGQRTIVFIFEPNWATSIKEWYAWLTDMIVSYNGTKQFRGLRAHPRWGIEFELAVRGDVKRLFDNQLFNRQALTYAVPLWWDASHLDQAVTIGDETIYCDTTHRGFAAGQRALIYRSSNSSESVEITAVTGNTLVPAQALSSSWPAGTRIYPMRYARLTQNQKLDRLTAGSRKVRVAFEADKPLAGTATESGVTYRGEPVYLAKPNWSADLTDEFRRALEILDYQTGTRFIYDKSGHPTIFQEMNWPLSNRAERCAFIEWLYARAGKYGGVWIPTHTADLIVTKLIGPSDSTIDIRYCGYTRYIKQRVNRRDIAIFDRLGGVHLHRITGSEQIDAATERISIAPDVLGVGLDQADIAKVSFLMYMHLASDKTEIEHLNGVVSQCTLTLESDNDDGV